MRSSVLARSVVGVLGVAALSCGKAPEPPPVPPGLVPSPERLAFLCVEPGCSVTQTVTVVVQGPRRVAIKRILLAGDAAPEFTHKPSEPAPFILGSGASFKVEVGYAPKGAPLPGEATLRVTYTDASADESPERLAAGELVIPLVRRLVGEPVLTAHPDTLTFVVDPGTSQTQAVELENAGYGNVPLELLAVDSEDPAVKPELPGARALSPGKKTPLSVTFVPKGEQHVSTRVLVRSSSGVRDLVIRVQGTSIAGPSVAMDPTGDIDFGELAKGQKRTLRSGIFNRGSQPLKLIKVTLGDSTGNVKLVAPLLDEPVTLGPLERAELELLVEGVSPGAVNAVVAVASNDPKTPVLSFVVKGTITHPKATVAPTQVDFGKLAVGWVRTRSVEIWNRGFGALKVKGVTLVGGSSNLFSVTSAPAFPTLLLHDQRTVVDVQFQAETMALFNGWLSVETDDPENQFLEVPLQALVASCADACPTAHGTASCSSGECGVGGCATGWYDVDRLVATGCECQEVGTDPGGFCADALSLGTLKDNDEAQTTVTQIVPLYNDVDVIRFFAQDAFALFNEKYRVRVQLMSMDPTLAFCVYRYDGGEASECFWNNEVCPSDRFYEHNGSSVSADDANFLVKVYRPPGAAPTCTRYTLYVSNGV